MKLKFPVKDFRKIHISYFIKIRPVGAELFHAARRKEGWTDGQTDMNQTLPIAILRTLL